MPAIRRIVYNGPLGAVDVPSVGLFGVEPGVPVEVGESAAEAVLTHPDFADADAPTPGGRRSKSTPTPATDTSSTDTTASEA